MIGRKLNTQEFIEKAKLIHNDKYDYSLVEYKRYDEKVKIICKKHGIFEQVPSSHLRKIGCLQCAGIKKLTSEEFIEKAKKKHGNIYDYSLVEYINSNTKVKIICKKHGIFEQVSNDHFSGHGCINCEVKRLTSQEFIEKSQKVHNNKYDYSLVKYINFFTKVKIICREHGEFLQRPGSHLQSCGCPQCPTIISKPHKKVIDFLLNLNFKEHKDFIINNRKTIKPFELDIYFPNYKLAIEIDGEYWHGKLEKCKEDKDYIKDREKRKNKICEQKEIKLLRFTDREINKNFEQVTSYLSKFLFISE